MNDLFRKQDAVDRISDQYVNTTGGLDRYAVGINVGLTKALNALKDTPPAKPRWIPFKSRPLTDEEKKEYPDCSFILDGKLPENGQRILVSIYGAGHENVQLDEFYDDDGVYLDSGYEIGREAVAWMPLPNPYHEAER